MQDSVSHIVYDVTISSTASQTGNDSSTTVSSESSRTENEDEADTTDTEDDDKSKHIMEDIFGEYTVSASDEERNDKNDNSFWENLRTEVYANIHEKVEEDIEKTMETNEVDKKTATKLVALQLLPSFRKSIYQLYYDKVCELKQMKKDSVHKRIMITKRRLIEEEDYEDDEALKYAIKRRKFLIQKASRLQDEDVFNDDDEDSDESGEDADDEDDKEEEQ